MNYHHKIRNRVGGICIQNGELLLVKHRNVNKLPELWIPPGGAVNPGESLVEALKREFIEETGLEIAVKRLLFVSEYIESPLHSLEFFFEVHITGGTLRTGKDPELPDDKQLIELVTFVDYPDLTQIPKEYVHHCFWYCNSYDDLYELPLHLPLLR